MLDVVGILQVMLQVILRATGSAERALHLLDIMLTLHFAFLEC